MHYATSICQNVFLYLSGRALHLRCSAKGCGFNSQGTHILIKKRIAWMHCKSLWIKASDKCIHVNNSSESSPVMLEEFEEHLTRDQRPFFHPESLQTLLFLVHVGVSSLQFTSLIFCRVQVRELEQPWQKLGFVPSDPFLFWSWFLFVEYCPL